MRTILPAIHRTLLALSIGALSYSCLAGDKEQALTIHNRIAGVPPSEAVLLQMTDLIATGDVTAAARIAMDNEAFYRVTLKNLSTPWTNRDQTPFAPLNDYTATVIGLVRDEDDFRKILFDDVIYTGADNLGLPAYGSNDNNHYETLESQNVDLKNALVRHTQSEITGLPASATAGVITTRAAARAFFYAGTNRAMLRFTLLNHLCRDLEQVHDTSRVPDRIRQDVTRSPGGDSREFLNSCIGCHSGMDPLAQSFAYYNYDYDIDNDAEGHDGRITYNTDTQIDPVTGTRVVAKYHNNNTTFPYGYITENDHWDNYWRKGGNSILAWDATLAGSGDGAKTMGMELAYSGAFAACQVEKVFSNVCLRTPGDADDRALISNATTAFSASGYNLKQVFIDTANYCKGE